MGSLAPLKFYLESWLIMLCILDFIGNGTETLPLINQIIYFVGLLFLFVIIIYFIFLVFFGIFYLIEDYQKLKEKVKNFIDEAIKSRIIIYVIKKMLGTLNGISKIHINDIISLCQNNIGNKYLTPNKHIKVLINRGKMYFFVTEKT